MRVELTRQFDKVGDEYMKSEKVLVDIFKLDDTICLQFSEDMGLIEIPEDVFFGILQGG